MRSDNRTFHYLKRLHEWNLYIPTNRLNYPRNKYEPRKNSSKEMEYVVEFWSRDSFFFSPLSDRCLEGERSVRGFCHREGWKKKKDGFIVSSLTGTISSVAQVSGERVRLVISLPLGAAAVVVVRKDLVIVNVTAGQQRAPAWTTHRSGHVCVS